MTPLGTLEDSNSRYRLPETDHPFLNMNDHNISKRVMLPVKDRNPLQQGRAG